VIRTLGNAGYEWVGSAEFVVISGDAQSRLRRSFDNDTIIRVTIASWTVEFHPGCEVWANDLDQHDAEALLAAVRVLRDQGPSLGRPLVDTIIGSRHKNMKELRPGSTGRSEVRVLFAFDKIRHAILLIGGDKSGDWSGWYDVNIPIADDRFDEHQRALAKKQAEELSRNPKDRKGTTTMSFKNWERKVLATPGAAERVAEIEDELRLSAGLTALREQAGLSQRELAERLGVSQPRIAAIERARNVTIDVLDSYVDAVGGQLEISVRKGGRKIALLSGQPNLTGSPPCKAEKKSA
jgi:predicted XRE-type DNA-binding protein